MADNETIADIVAEKRRQADKIERNCAEMIKRGKMISDCYVRELVADIRREADRLEAAWKREAVTDCNQFGNAAKLREALKAIGGLCAGLMPTWDGAVGRIKDMAETALAAPPRNCDKVKTSWDVLKEWHEGLDTANDIVRMLDWLLAPATEKEGGAK